MKAHARRHTVVAGPALELLAQLSVTDDVETGAGWRR